ncbi:hypothetical protein BB561_006598 [Smittium simulii]|uniref:Uncharacterized protein n=1 Tax=Smittium simulii TaxID=133385 RepID=A0A2T9Y2Y2_9FUNG|nr:hypothetical protein BB561_006598 [Smittium simulii]
MKNYFSSIVFIVFFVLLSISEASNARESGVKKTPYTLEEITAKENAIIKKLNSIDVLIKNFTESQLGEFVALNSTISQSQVYNYENCQKMKAIFNRIKKTDKAVDLLQKSLEAELSECFYNYGGCSDDSIVTKKSLRNFYRYASFRTMRDKISDNFIIIGENEDKDYEMLIKLNISLIIYYYKIELGHFDNY